MMKMFYIKNHKDTLTIEKYGSKGLASDIYDDSMPIPIFPVDNFVKERQAGNFKYNGKSQSRDEGESQK
eukprot:Awhi_evm1s11965